MATRNPESPWNPANSVDITATELEDLVYDWLVKENTIESNITFEKQGRVFGDGGEYKIDILISLTLYNSTEIKILVECKRYTRPVERKVVAELIQKLQDTKSQKGMIFSTSGFQKGALELAKSYNIAAVTVTGEEFATEYRSLNTEYEFMIIPDRIFSGLLLSISDNVVASSRIDKNRLSVLRKWLVS